MKLIPSYQEFVYDLPLNGKISPELAESLAAKFEEIESLNEGFLDSIKNTLSKTFLGSLSYINMIDKAREIVLKDQKDLLSKQYSHEDEIDSLNDQLKQLQESGDKVNSERIKKSISNKENEYRTYVNMVKKRIVKAEDTISDVIKGNKRRSEYYDAGKSQDELAIAEFEYKLAKSRANSDPKEIKSLEIKVKDAKKEATEARDELKRSSEEAAAENKSQGKEKPKYWEKAKEIQDKIEELKLEIRNLKRKKEDEGGKLNYSDSNTLKGNQASLDKAIEDLKKFKGGAKPREKKNDQKNTNSKTGTTMNASLGGKSSGSIAAAVKKGNK
jgi:chromosome segregation ATPase